MKLNEVLKMGGAGYFIRPSTLVNQQVVQPRTIQAMNPEQMGQGYEMTKSKQKEQHEIDVEVYNDRDVDHIKDPYNDPEELDKKLKKTVFAIDNEEISSLEAGWEKFAADIGRTYPNDPRARFAIVKSNNSNYDASNVNYVTGQSLS